MSGRAVRLLALAATVAALALPAAGCKTTVDEITGSVAEPRAPSTEAEWRGALETYGNRYRANPSDAKAAGAYARALADTGQYTEALDALSRAHSPDNPDWRILNAQGAVLDEMGRHAEAQRHYATVLKMVPNEPSVLSNLGLSYALDKKLPQAEATLRQAAALAHAGPKVRQNLALVVGLQGRFAEAEKIAGADLPSDQAAANVNYLRQMLAQRNDWKKMGRHMPVPDAGT